jgi:hypothetical protein
MNKQSLIQCLHAIRDNVSRGENKAALLNLAKLEVCLQSCECDAAPDHRGFPVITQEHTI